MASHMQHMQCMVQHMLFMVQHMQFTPLHIMQFTLHLTTQFTVLQLPQLATQFTH